MLLDHVRLRSPRRCRCLYKQLRHWCLIVLPLTTRLGGWQELRLLFCTVLLCSLQGERVVLNNKLQNNTRQE